MEDLQQRRRALQTVELSAHFAYLFSVAPIPAPITMVVVRHKAMSTCQCPMLGSGSRARSKSESCGATFYVLEVAWRDKSVNPITSSRRLCFSSESEANRPHRS